MRAVEIEGSLAAAGFLGPQEEAAMLVAAAEAGEASAETLLERRLDGEPLAWIVGSVTFCGVRIRVDPGVFVPRPQTELLAERAVELLPAAGLAVDLCTGTGAVARVLQDADPTARVLATDLDAAAVDCARANGVDALLGDLDAPIPASLGGHVDVVTAVVPYVPTDELAFLPRDVVEHEPRLALDGGVRGTALLARAVEAAARSLRPGGAAILELGGDQAAEISVLLQARSFVDIRVHRDDEGQDRAIEAHASPVRAARQPLSEL